MEWQRDVHALSGGTKLVYNHSSPSYSLYPLHLLAHANRQHSSLGAGLSIPRKTGDGGMDGWMGDVPKATFRFPCFILCVLWHLTSLEHRLL